MNNIMNRPWLHPEYEYRFVAPNGEDIYTSELPILTDRGVMTDTTTSTDKIGWVDSEWATYNWHRSLQRRPTEKPEGMRIYEGPIPSMAMKPYENSVESYIGVKIITPQKTATARLRCLITPALEILLEDTVATKKLYDPRPTDFVVNVTEGTYHKVGGVDIILPEDPVLEAIKWLPLDHIKIRKVNFINYGVIAITEGLIFQETHIYVFQGSKLVAK